MIDRPISARTRKNNHLYRHPYRKSGKVVHAENYTFRKKRRGKSYYFNLGTDIKRAKVLADDIAAFLAVKTNSIEDAVAVFSPEKGEIPVLSERKIPTVGEISRRYVEVINHLRSATVRDNICALRRIAAFVLGLPPNRAITTSNFYMRAAGSMFSKKLLKHYADFSLPEPIPFKEIGQLQEPSHRYISKIDLPKLIADAENELRGHHPASYVAFVLSLYCGMRRGEIDLLIWEQIDFEQRHIWIRRTEYFSPKARNSENRIDAPAKVFEILEAFRVHSVTPPYVLPGASSNYPPRCKNVFRALLKWLRQHGVAQVQALHTLRKEAGSLMYSQTGSIDKAAEFLRNDPRVAREHYIGRNGRLELRLPDGHRESPAG